MSPEVPDGLERLVGTLWATGGKSLFEVQAPHPKLYTVDARTRESVELFHSFRIRDATEREEARGGDRNPDQEGLEGDRNRIQQCLRGVC